MCKRCSSIWQRTWVPSGGITAGAATYHSTPHLLLSLPLPLRWCCCGGSPCSALVIRLRLLLCRLVVGTVLLSSTWLTRSCRRRCCWAGSGLVRRAAHPRCCIAMCLAPPQEAPAGGGRGRHHTDLGRLFMSSNYKASRVCPCCVNHSAGERESQAKRGGSRAAPTTSNGRACCSLLLDSSPRHCSVAIPRLSTALTRRSLDAAHPQIRRCVDKLCVARCSLPSHGHCSPAAAPCGATHGLRVLCNGHIWLPSCIHDSTPDRPHR